MFRGDRDGVCAHGCWCTYRPEEGALSLELGFLMVMSHLSWVWGEKLASAAKEICACNCWAILPAPKVEFREPCTALSNYWDLIWIAHFEEEEAKEEQQQIVRKNWATDTWEAINSWYRWRAQNQWNKKKVYKAQSWLFDIFNKIDKLHGLNLANEGMRKTTEIEHKSSILVITGSYRVNRKGRGPYGKFVTINSTTWI